jgi:hypothetical protein
VFLKIPFLSDKSSMSRLAFECPYVRGGLSMGKSSKNHTQNVTSFVSSQELLLVQGEILTVEQVKFFNRGRND